MTGPDKTSTPETRSKVDDDTILKIAKEITVKFIEVGRITPVTFAAVFPDIHMTIEKTVRKDKS